MKRANYIGAPHYFNLNQACLALVEAFGQHIYLVGSSMERRDFRDVDVRCIIDDAEYARLFPGLSGNPSVNGLWSLMCTSISEWLSNRTSLPVDFQIQKRSEANKEFDGPRSALGLFIIPNQVGGKE